MIDILILILYSMFGYDQGVMSSLLTVSTVMMLVTNKVGYSNADLYLDDHSLSA